MSNVSDFFVIRSFTAAGTADLGGVRSRGGNLFGAMLQIEASGNFEASILADHFGDGVYADVTSMFNGGATITQADVFCAVPNYLPWAMRLHVTSVQADNHVRVAAGF